LEAARAGLWEWNLKTGENIWSNEIWMLYGLEKDDKKPCIDLWASTIHPDDREMAIQAVSTAADNETLLKVEYRVRYLDGSVHWLMSRGKPLYNDKGKVDRYIGTVIDITERKEAEMLLYNSKKRLTFALEAMHTGVWEWNVKTDEVTWTDNVWQLYGLEQNSLPLTHRLCESNIHPEDRDLIFEKVMAAARKEIEINIEYRVCHKDGSIHWLQCQGVPNYSTNSSLTSYIGMINDITLRKELLNELLENKERLSQALEAARAGVWEWNLNTGKNIWSDEVWFLYGLEKNDQEPCFDLWASTIHTDDREMAIQTISTAADNETLLKVEYRVRYLDGSVHWLMSRGKPLYNDKGKVDRYIGTVIDITEKKNIELKLVSNRERLEFILENSEIGVWDINLQNGKTECTLEHARIFGYKTIPPIWSFEKFLDHVIPDDRSRIEALISSSIEKNINYSFECQIHCENGELRWIWVTGSCKINKHSNSKHVVGIVKDITKRKKAEQELVASKATLHAALASMNDALFITDADKTLIEFNDAFAQFHRFRDKSECPKNFADYHENYEMFMDNDKLAPLALWPVARTFRGEVVSNAEYRLRRKDTGETWFGSYSFAPIHNNEGKIVGSVIAARDITEQKLIQKALEESEVKFRTIFDHSPVAIGIQDISSGVLYDVNTAFLELFGFSKEEVSGKSLNDLELFIQIEDHEKIISKIKENRKVINYPFRFQKKSGKIATILFSSDFVLLNGKPIMLIMMMDITLQELQKVSIERLEQIVADRTRQLNQEVKRLNSFLHMISHEYRTPLAIIRGNLDLIEMKNKPCNIKNTSEINKIRRAIDRLVSVMEESIHESRFFESRTELPLKPFRLLPIIESQINSFLDLWPDRIIQYSNSIENGEIFGDSSQIKLALFNLLDNARKYSSPDSTIELDCHQKGDNVVISIRNQSQPISEDETEVLFEKYQRGSTSMNTGGAGLGLWMVKNIITQHNGQVSIKSIESGVEATIRLPLFQSAG